ncbi:hypothetical protein DFJ73DRAFT_862449 [Zopfochytrium polystomum]|nr:hypothetical protein DFJ73DRAFT_862449 [Zopfochytrium polystomum]
MDSIELAFFVGVPNVMFIAASSFILVRYRTDAATFDLSQPTHLYCEMSSQYYLWADLALAACVIVGGVFAWWFNCGRTPIGLVYVGKLALNFAGLAFVLPVIYCKSGDFVLWVYCAFRIVGFLAGAVMYGNHAIGLEASVETMPGWREYLFTSFNGAIVGIVSFFLVKYDTPFASVDDALASPPPTWPAAAYSLLSNTTTGELPDLILCEQSVSSYLYYELALSLSVVAQFATWFYYSVIMDARHQNSVDEGVHLELERGVFFTVLLKAVALVFESVKVFPAKVCPASNPLFHRCAIAILAVRFAEIVVLGLWLPIGCSQRQAENSLRERLRRYQLQPLNVENTINQLTRVFLYRPQSDAPASDEPEEACVKASLDLAAQLGGADHSGSTFVIAVEDDRPTQKRTRPIMC